jgi:hypothetical protein
MNLGSVPTAIAVADFNGDGALDFAAATAIGWIPIFLGHGDGTFSFSTQYPGNSPTDIALGDFDGDGVIDMAIADGPQCDFQIAIGHGDGTFGNGWFEFTNCDVGITAAHLNRDDKLDIAITTSVYFGVTQGRFYFGALLAAPGSPQKIVVGDFDGNGTPDLATADATAGASVFLGDGLGGFQAPVTFPAGNQSRSLVAGDFNRDGHLDLVLANRGGASITTLLQSTLR